MSDDNWLLQMAAQAMLPHPSGECRCCFPGTNIACTLPQLHDGDHEAPPIRLLDGSMSQPIRWEQNRPREATDG